MDYPVLSLPDIGDVLLKINQKYGDIDHILFLWTIDKYLWEAEAITNRMGYKLHARMIWNKVTGIPAAFTIRYGHEYLLYMYYGKFLPVAKEERGRIPSVFTEEVKSHSQKPVIAYQIIERLYPNMNKLELFARKKRKTLWETWDVWGNEVENDVELMEKK